MEITRQSENVSIPGHRGTWYTIDETTIDGKKYFLMEHEKYGDEALHVILDHNGSLVLEDVANGFDDLREHFLSEDEEWEKHYSKTSQETKAESPPLPQRLFVDMDTVPWQSSNTWIRWKHCMKRGTLPTSSPFTAWWRPSGKSTPITRI